MSSVAKSRREDERDFLRLGENFYIGFLYGDVPDESEFLRTARSDLAGNQVRQRGRNEPKILDSGLVRKLEVPDPHLYFQAPGGNAGGWWESTRTCPFMKAAERANVAKVKEAVGASERSFVTFHS